MRRFRSIRLRLTLWYVALLAVILAAFSAGIYLTLRHNLSQNLNDSLQNRAAVLLGVVTYKDGRPTLPEDAAPQGVDADEQIVRVYDANGRLVSAGAAPPDADPAPANVLRGALAGHVVTTSVDVGGDTMRARLLPIEREGETIGVLEIALPTDDMSETLGALLLILVIAYPSTLAVASLGGVFLASRALAPIDRITRLARRISAEDLRQRLDLAPSEDELGRLARTFNDMIARLEAAFQRQRQFTADASHELRTPLTAVKGQVEVALSHPRDGDAYREVLRIVNQEVDRMIRLVGSLLTLARADAGEIPIAADPIDLREVVTSALDHVQPAADKKNVHLSAEGEGRAILRADHDLLLQLVLNLLDNALKYTEPGGSVTAGWSVADGVVRCWVRDTGIGISSAEQPHIFDRFYRVDRARSRASGGAGLGLSIARWIAEAHGGGISVESAPGRGARFTVTLPRNGG